MVVFKMEATATPFSRTRIEQVCKVLSLAPQVSDVLGDNTAADMPAESSLHEPFGLLFSACMTFKA